MNVSLRSGVGSGLRVTVVGALVALLGFNGCAAVGAGNPLFSVGAANSSDSAGSSDSGASSKSGNSSDGSGNSANSSQGSANASGNSADASNGSADSSGSSGSSGESSADSSKSTANGSLQALLPITAGVVVSATTTGLGVLFWFAVSQAGQQINQAKAAQAFLRANRHQLEQDLALGAGRSIEDLASVAEIPREHLPRLGRVLRTHRSELLEMAEPELLTPERAAAWMRHVGELSRADPELARDGARFEARHAERG